MSSNKKPLAERIEDVQAIFKKSGYNPFERLINQGIRAASRNDSISQQGKMDIDSEKLELAVNTELCKYIAPTLKAVELTADVDANVSGGVSVNVTIGNKEAVAAFTKED